MCVKVTVKRAQVVSCFCETHQGVLRHLSPFCLSPKDEALTSCSQCRSSLLHIAIKSRAWIFRSFLPQNAKQCDNTAGVLTSLIQEFYQCTFMILHRSDCACCAVPLHVVDLFSLMLRWPFLTCAVLCSASYFWFMTWSALLSHHKQTAPGFTWK